MKYRHAIRQILSFALVISLAACHTEPDPVALPPPPPAQPQPPSQPPSTPPAGPLVTAAGVPIALKVTQTIGTDGGALQTDDGALRLIIPAGALTAPTEISIQAVTNTLPSGVGFGLKLEPEGLTFAKPVELQFTPTADSTEPLGLLGLAFQSADGQWQQVIQDPVVISSAVRSSRVRPAGLIPLGSSSASLKFKKFRGKSASLFGTYRLVPARDIVKVGLKVDLTLQVYRPVYQVCDPNEDCLATIPGYYPAPSTTPTCCLSVNGQVGGNTTVGTIEPKAGATEKIYTYTAPAQRPAANPVSVSVNVTEKGNQQILVAPVRVEDTDWAGNVDFQVLDTQIIDTSTATSSFKSEAYITYAGRIKFRLKSIAANYLVFEVVDGSVFGTNAFYSRYKTSPNSACKPTDVSTLEHRLSGGGKIFPTDFNQASLFLEPDTIDSSLSISIPALTLYGEEISSFSQKLDVISPGCIPSPPTTKKEQITVSIPAFCDPIKAKAQGQKVVESTCKIEEHTPGIDRSTEIKFKFFKL
jgi:hypothetical protein